MGQHYLCTKRDGKLIPIMGPMRENEVVAIIVCQGENQRLFSNCSRNWFYNQGFPRNKKGDIALSLCIESAQPERGLLDLSKPIEIRGVFGAHIATKQFYPTPTGLENGECGCIRFVGSTTWYTDNCAIHNEPIHFKTNA